VGPSTGTQVLSIYDGTKGYRCDFGMALVMFESTPRSSGNLQQKLGLIDFYGGPPSTALATSRARVVGEEIVNASKTIKLHAPEYMSGACTWWLSPARGYACIKQEMTFSRMNAAQTSEFTSKQAVYQVDRFLEVKPGMWLPAEGTTKIWITKRDGSKVWLETTWFKVVEFEVNLELPDSIFTINEEDFPVGFQVGDTIGKRNWVVGGDTTALQQAVSSGKFPPGVKEPKQP